MVVTAVEPLCAYLCREGLARFCTAKYETPTAAKANEAYMHLTNYSVTWHALEAEHLLYNNRAAILILVVT